MGRLFLQRQDYAKAAAAFNRAREHDPRNPDAIAGLGQIAYHQAKYEDATVHFRAAVRLAPNRASLHVWLGHSLLGSGHAREAESEYRAALQIEPSNGPAQQGLEAARKR
jgi:cytochrome c-type biogenesis protein CcmH/NrfG